MQNIYNKLRQLEELQFRVSGDDKKKVRQELDRLRRLIMYFSQKTTPIRSHEIEYESFITN